MICFSMLNQDLGTDFLESRHESFTHPILLEEFLHFLFGRVVLMQELLDEDDFPLPEQTNELRRFGHHILHVAHRRERPHPPPQPPPPPPRNPSATTEEGFLR